MDAIEVNKLRRVFKTTTGFLKRKVKEVVAVEEISFSVEGGELFGLLGPNGAGKTTTVKMLTTLLIPSGGSASIMGLDVVKDAEKVRPWMQIISGSLPLTCDIAAFRIIINGGALREVLP